MSNEERKQPPPDDPRAADWQWQLAERVTSAPSLASRFTLSPGERAAFGLPGLPPVAVTPYYLSLMDPEDPRCPIRQQALPHPEDVEHGAGESSDPLGERSRSPVPGVVHRYPDRVVLLVAVDCPVRCRHCNRRQRTADEFLRTEADFDAALAYLAARPDVREVILSGGDPLTLSDAVLARILEPLGRLPHIGTVRVHTRAPVTCPMRVTDDLVRVLRAAQPLFVLTQFNHPAEVTPRAAAAAA